MHRRARGFKPALIAASALLATLAMAAPASAISAVHTVCASGCQFTTIQAAIDDPGTANGGTILVRNGTYDEDVAVNKSLTLVSENGPSTTTIRGISGGDTATVHVLNTGVVIDGFTITRQATPATWDDPLNLAGVAVQGQSNDVTVKNSVFNGNRTAVDINDSDDNTIQNNVIDDNRTGVLIRNHAENTMVKENRISNNWTVGVLFIDGAGASGQSIAGSQLSNNSIFGNWYAGIQDRQAGGLPKDFSANWFGTTTPTVTTVNTTEPGYSALIPVSQGGTATPPGGAPDIAGTGSANFDYTPLLRSGTDTAPSTPGFQGNFSDLTVTLAGNQTQAGGRLQEGIDRATEPGTVHVLAGTYAETVNVNKNVDLTGAGIAGTVIDPPANGPALSVSASGTVLDPLTISQLKTTGAGGSGNIGSGLQLPVSVSDVTFSHVRSTDNTGNGLAVNTASPALGNITRLRLDSVDFSSNDLDGMRIPTSMGTLDGLTIVDSHFDGNVTGLEIFGPPSTSPVTNVSITDSSFDRNDAKGIYTERLSNALLDNISVDESGTSGAVSFTAGIDLNLKKQVFSNITISNSRITNSGTGDPVNGVGLAIKSRDGGTDTGNGPTSVTGVNVTHNTITGNQLGVRVGEPGKSNNGPTGVTINRNNISGNVGGAGMTNVTAVAAPVDATCNWWGSAGGPAGGGNSVTGNITFTPFLLSSNLDVACKPPVANDDSGATTAEDTPLVVAASGVLGNDTDPDSRPLTAVKTSDPAHGTVTLSPNGGYTYTPAANYNGPDSFKYKANNGGFDSSEATVSLNVTPVNDPPVAVNDIGSVAEDGTLNGTTVLVNDTDTEGSPLTASKASDPSHGTVTVAADGTYVYTPAANYNGPDSFTYKANDGSTDSTLAATVSITVTPVNDAPVAVGDVGTVPEDGTLTRSSTTGVLLNDTDVEGDHLTAVKVSDPAHGTVDLDPSGAYTYTPASNYNGPDSFSYKANDGTNDSNVAVVSIAVGAGNDPPVAVDDTGTVAEDGVLNGTSVLPNDTDTEGSPLSASKASDPSHGTVTVAADGTYVYTPAANYNGPDSFTYKANDGTADSGAATVAITVTPVNDAPVAADDSATVNEDGTLTGVAPGVLGNDSDVDGQTLSATKVSDPAHGTLTLGSNGSYEYAPAADYNGPDSFTYKASDGSTDSNVATVSITVNPVAETPGAEPEDKLAPVFLAARLTNKTFRVNVAGAAETVVSAVATKKRAKKGTTFVYTLSEKARVVFTIEKRKKGKRARFSRVGRFAQDAKTGANRKKFSGKLGKKRLKAGRYRASLKATDAAGNVSVVKRLSFKVVRR